MSTIPATNASRLYIAMPHVRRNIVINIRSTAIDEWRSYTMRNSSNNPPLMKTAQYVSYGYQNLKRDVDIRHAVEKLFAMDVSLQMQ